MTLVVSEAEEEVGEVAEEEVDEAERQSEEGIGLARIGGRAGGHKLSAQDDDQVRRSYSALHIHAVHIAHCIDDTPRIVSEAVLEI